jgi:hypothetical protein
MRFASWALIAVLLLSSASALVTSGKSSCCCDVRAGASCPMQSHEGNGCTTSCGLRQAQPFAGTMPSGNRNSPALIPQERVQPPAVAALGFLPHATGMRNDAALPPDPPPPRRA